ncbi:hypothetical protein Dimus_005964, partial [Dionaea muscipula]
HREPASRRRSSCSSNNGEETKRQGDDELTPRFPSSIPRCFFLAFDFPVPGSSSPVASSPHSVSAAAAAAVNDAVQLMPFFPSFIRSDLIRSNLRNSISNPD